MRNLKADTSSSCSCVRASATTAAESDFVLNKPQFRNPGILVTGQNFGAGSRASRGVGHARQ